MILKASGIYLGWVGYENLGDEAMWHACRERFPAIAWSTMSDIADPLGLDVTRRARDVAWIARILREEWRDPVRLRMLTRKCTHRIVSALTREVGILGGGTLINRNQDVLQAYLDLRNKLNRPIPTFGTGVANREYWSQAESSWVDRRKEWVHALRELPVVGVRGPDSKAALEEAGLSNVVVCGDPAVLLHEPLRELTGPKESLTIAVNFGEPAGGMLGQMESLEVQLSTFVKAVGGKHRVKMLPVWSEDIAACTRLALRSGLSESSVTRPCTTHGAFHEEMREVDLVIAFKMHAGILAAVYNVPFVLIEYQPKCRDFLASAGLEHLGMRPDQFDPDFLLHQVDEVVSRAPVIRQDICGSMCRLAHDFEAYCRVISPLLA